MPGETPELKALYGAKVNSIEIIGEHHSPALPGANLMPDMVKPVYRTAIVKLSVSVQSWKKSRGLRTRQVRKSCMPLT